jgi:hypothetical protein
MGDDTKAVIEALHYVMDRTTHQIGDQIGWPWQSVQKHLKIVNDRMQFGRDCLEKVLERGEETIAKYHLRDLPQGKGAALDMIIGLAAEAATQLPKEPAPVAEGPAPIRDVLNDFLGQLKAEAEAEPDPEPVREDPAPAPPAEEQPAAITEEPLKEEPQPARKCRVCGCDDNFARLRGCYWVKPDLCSRCAEELRFSPSQENAGKPADKAEDPTPVQPVETEKPESAQNEPLDKEYWDNLDKKYQRDLPFITALQSFCRRMESGDILATCMLVDESRGIFRIDFEKK